jgi:predicted metalloprotease
VNSKVIKSIARFQVSVKNMISDIHIHINIYILTVDRFSIWGWKQWVWTWSPFCLSIGRFLLWLSVAVSMWRIISQRGFVDYFVIFREKKSPDGRTRNSLYRLLKTPQIICQEGGGKNIKIYTKRKLFMQNISIQVGPSD